MPSDDVRLWLGIILLTFVIFLKGFFTACETAVVEFNDAKLKSLAEKDAGAKRLIKLLSKPSGLLTALSLHRILSAVLATVLFFILLHPVFLNAFKALGAFWSSVLSGVCVILIASLVLAVLGEALPKRLLIGGSEKFALKTAGLLKILVTCLLPLSAAVSGITYLLSLIFGVSSSNGNDAVTEEEILLMVDAGNETGVIEESQKEMINNIFEFGDIQVSDVMTHRTDIVAVALSATVSEVVNEAIQNGFSRIPVYENGIDNIIGVVNVKDLLCLIGSQDTSGIPLKNFLREVPYVPETNKCDEVFKRLTSLKMQMAVAVDEYGGTAGIVTMEDLLEAIVGNMQDEYDKEGDELTQVSDNIYIIDGTADPEEILEDLGLALPDGQEYDTMGGFIVDLLGRIPKEDETPTVVYKNAEFTVLLIEEKRVSRIKAVIKPEAAAEE